MLVIIFTGRLELLGLNPTASPPDSGTHAAEATSAPPLPVASAAPEGDVPPGGEQSPPPPRRR